VPLRRRHRLPRLYNHRWKRCRGCRPNASLTLSNNGGDSLTLHRPTAAFQFATGLASNVAYSVAITTAPGGEKWWSL